MTNVAIWRPEARKPAFLETKRLVQYKEKSVKEVKVSKVLVQEVMEALKSLCNVPATTELPCWLGDGMPDPQNLIVFKNGLLDIETDEFNDHSADFFSLNCLDYDYDPNADCPNLYEFLKGLSQGEEDWEASLQRWFGYNLIPDTSQQKMMLFAGPPRSGKGTICRILQDVLGKHNYVNPTFHSLGKDFGLAPLVGKLAAICPDAHIGRGSDAIAIMERLKSIIGEDSASVNRKYKNPINLKLGVRFTVSVNELPSFPDVSGSMKARLIVLPFRESYEGREDTELYGRLAAEIAGICNWGIKGLKELRREGRLIQPRSGTEILEDFADLGSPVRDFIEDRCELVVDGNIACKDLFDEWIKWCDQNGHRSGSSRKFGMNLKSAFPKIARKRIREGEKHKYVYEGVVLKAEVY